MQNTLNRIQLIGAVGREPDVKIDERLVKVAFLSLATKRTTEDHGERTDWHLVTLRDRLAQFAEDCIGTGTRLWVEGEVEYGTYERDGVVIPTTEVRAQRVIILAGSKL